MNWSLLNVLKNFTYLRYSLGIMIMFNGFPLVFFLRETLHILPYGSIYTAIFMGLGLVLMLPPHLFKQYYKPNIVLFNLGLGFLLISLYYFLFINFQGKAIADVGNFALTLGFLALLLHMPSDVKDTLLAVIFVVSFFSNLAIVYSLLTDPNWTPGMRAAISFGNDGDVPTGNPHITARTGVVCLVSAVVLLVNSKDLLTRAFLFFASLFSLGIIVLSLAKSSYLSVALMAGAYFVYKFKARNILSGMRALFKFQSLAILAIILVGINAFLARYGNVFNLLLVYYDTFEDRILDVIFTSTGVQLTDTAAEDASAMGRVGGFSTFLDTLYSWNAFLGQGFKYEYLDIPILETFVNQGIIGFTFFAAFNIFLGYYSIKEIKNNTSPLNTFLAYIFVAISILLFTGGRPYDVVFWFPYCVMIRFLGANYSGIKPQIPTVQTQLVTPTT